MAAPTSTYCDYDAGNDYKGASFTDGAYTSATKTLVKANAFTASKVNHWLYLESNDGGSIVAGYYRIATWTDASTVILATDAGGGTDDDAAKCTQHDGTTSLPWRSVQGALDLITRDATNGDQINVKAGTAQVNAAALALTTYGTPAEGIPLIIRGYTSAANDGGIGEIDCNGFSMFAAATFTDVGLINLEIHNGGANHLVSLSSTGRNFVHSCELHKGASTPTSKALLNLGNGAEVTGCYIHDAGTTGFGINNASRCFGNYVVNCTIGIALFTYGVAKDNIINVPAGGVGIRSDGDTTHIGNNAIYSAVANTGTGVNASSAAGAAGASVLNNILVGFSGAGGKGIAATGDLSVLGHNAFYNCNTPESIGDVHLDFGNDVTLAADPFTDAANGDFSLTAAAKTALAAKGFPLAYLGAHANTVPNLNIGPIQMAAGGAAGGGFPILGGSVVR